MSGIERIWWHVGAHRGFKAVLVVHAIVAEEVKLHILNPFKSSVKVRSNVSHVHAVDKGLYSAKFIGAAMLFRFNGSGMCIGSKSRRRRTSLYTFSARPRAAPKFACIADSLY